MMSSNTKDVVFLSYKFHDQDGHILPDYFMARELYEKLAANNIKAFFSDESIVAAGRSDYKKLIDEKLDEASILVVVSTDKDYCNSSWVRYEWDSFYNDLLSDRKKGCLVSYLDSDDISSFPRTIRTNQVFSKKTDGLQLIVEFISNYINNNEYKEVVSDDAKGSSYGYTIGDERKRLEIQSKVESSFDYEYIKELLTDKDKVYNILDVGCSMGAVTFNVFGRLQERIKLVGVDKFEVCEKEFNQKSPYPNMKAEVLNFEDADWTEKLSDIMQKYDIQKFDLIYCSLSLHHMSDSGLVLKKLWSFLSAGGSVYVRTCDDGLKIAYPKESIVQDIIAMTARVSRVSDRFHGRKIYTQMQKAKFENIRMKSFLIDTSNKTTMERYALFMSAFAWRKNYFKNQLNNAKTKEEITIAMENYNKVVDTLDKIEDLFSDLSFYFGYYVTIAIAEKPNSEFLY